MKFLVIEDHPMMLAAISNMVSSSFDGVNVGVANTFDEANKLLNLTPKYDVLLVDLNFSGELVGYDLIQNIKAKNADSKVVVLSMHTEKAYIEKAFKLGVDAYVVKSEQQDEICNAIKSVLKNESYKSAEVRKALESSKESIDLSPRELDIALLVKKGLSSKEIASKLGISYRTVECHRYKIMGKLGVSNTAQLIQALP